MDCRSDGIFSDRVSGQGMDLQHILGVRVQLILGRPLEPISSADSHCPAVTSSVTGGCHLKVWTSALRRLTHTYFWSTELGVPGRWMSFGACRQPWGLAVQGESCKLEKINSSGGTWADRSLREQRLPGKGSQEEFHVIHMLREWMRLGSFIHSTSTYWAGNTVMSRHLLL